MVTLPTNKMDNDNALSQMQNGVKADRSSSEIDFAQSKAREQAARS